MKLKIKRALLTASAASFISLYWSAGFAETPAPGAVKLPTGLEDAIGPHGKVRLAHGEAAGTPAVGTSGLIPRGSYRRSLAHRRSPKVMTYLTNCWSVRVKNKVSALYVGARATRRSR
jgi:hypothetical protein